MNLAPAFALRLRELGTGFNLQQVREVYEPLLATQPTDGVRVHYDLRYGSDERHVLDVYEPVEGDGEVRPILVYFHGGGFIRGDKRDRANVGWYFARHNVVTVLCNYRLAPVSQWPAGPEDVVRVAQWVARHCGVYGGRSDCLVLAGESAGAAHVAAATLIARYRQSLPVGFRGAALLSGPYNAHLEGLASMQFGAPTPDPRNEAYFGSDRALWQAASTVELIDTEPCPLLISFAERDLVQMQVQAGELFARLVTKHAYSPRLHVIPDHNHFSQSFSFNTGDESVSGMLRDFIAGLKFAKS
ncbi:MULTISPECIES: alpha/beta hydrolase [unclassified Burkholderia]|uniref:alpha/beta hydrolase n=1 Tax=unclassified Burkholderia TaxID=2613784 RepID=UPI002AB211DC|nr:MULTISPECIES: alpha/beta hydrolase [unclassified Burkholderia]